MVSEKVLKAELRRALDETLPPVPWLESRVAEGLRRERPKAVTRRRPWGLSTRTMQLAAAVLIVAIGVAAFVALHRPTPEPAGSLTVHDYQALIARDATRWNSAAVPGYDCLNLQSLCEAPGRPVQKALQTWLSDLNGVTPPDRFVVIHAQLKRHLAALVADMNALFASYKAQDQGAFDRAGNAMSIQQEWLGGVPPGIVASTDATVSNFKAHIQIVWSGTSVCTACEPLISTSDPDCAQVQLRSCQIDIGLAGIAIGNLQSDLVRYVPPSALAARDEQLQFDVARADTGLLEMSKAGLTNDQAGFDAGRALLQRALPAINADITAILGS